MGKGVAELVTGERGSRVSDGALNHHNLNDFLGASALKNEKINENPRPKCQALPRLPGHAPNMKSCPDCQALPRLALLPSDYCCQPTSKSFSSSEIIICINDVYGRVCLLWASSGVLLKTVLTFQHLLTRFPFLAKTGFCSSGGVWGRRPLSVSCFSSRLATLIRNHLLHSALTPAPKKLRQPSLFPLF